MEDKEGREITKPVQKGKSEIKFFLWTSNSSKDFIDIREFVTKDGKSIPTKNGIVISVEMMESFSTSIEDIVNKLKEAK